MHELFTQVCMEQSPSIKVHRLSQGLDGYVSDSFSFTKTTLSLAEEETHSIYEYD